MRSFFKKEEKKQKEFNALYYPYTRIENVETLKRALLLYDKIYLIYPTEYYEGIGISHDEEGIFSEQKYYFTTHHITGCQPMLYVVILKVALMMLQIQPIV